MSVIEKRTVFTRGAGGTPGKGGNLPSGRVPSEAPDTLQSRSTARFLDVWCEGEIEGLVDEDKSIFFNDTPLQNSDGTWNFNGIGWDTRYGLPWGGQSYMSGFPQSTSVVQVSSGLGAKITHASPHTETFTDTTGSMSAVIVKLSIPALFDGTNDDGSVKASNAEYRIQLKTGAGSFVDMVHEAFGGKCTSTYQRDLRLALPPHAAGTQFSIKVIQDPPDLPQTRIKNEYYFTAYTTVVDGKLAHPNVAYAGIQIDTAQFSGSAPSRSYDIKGLKIKLPNNYDPVTRAYNVGGAAFTSLSQVAWSDNPAWCFYDLLTNTRYGLGLPPGAVDPWKWDLYTIAQYCDELVSDGNGGQEPRFTCNLCLNSRQEAYAAVNQLASIFRSMPFWSAGAVRAVADMPKAPVALFTNSNVIGGEFKYEGTSLKARHTVAKVVWNDPDDAWRPAAEFVEDPTGVSLYGVRQIDLVASGCTSRGQAIRLGKWTLDTERTSTETVHFRTGLDGADKMPGDIVSIADENYAQKVIGGRASAATTTSLVLDAPFTIVSGHSYTLKVMLPDGTMAAKTLTNAAGSTSTLTWSGALSAAPLANAVWAITETALATREFLIVSNAEAGPATFEIMAVFYDPAKFQRVEQNILTAPNTYNVTPTGDIEPPSNLSSILHHAIVGSAIVTSVVVSWERGGHLEAGHLPGFPLEKVLIADSRVYAYDVQARLPDSPTWQDVGVSSTTSIEYQDAEEGFYDFRVRSKALNGRNSPWVELLEVALTSQVQPSDVTGLSLLTDVAGVSFKWTPVTDLNVFQYEIRQGASWASGTVVGRTTEAFFARQGLAAGSYTWWVAAVTSPQGTYSANAARLDVSIAIPGSPAITGVISGADYILSWPAVTSTRLIDRYDLYYGPTLIGATLIGSTRATTYQAPINWLGARVFWIVPTDVSGTPGVPSATTVIVAAPGAPSNLTIQVIDNNVLLRWTAPTATLPIVGYTVKRGATPTTDYASSTLIGTKTGTFTSYAETTGGTFIYWVAAVDSAGNEGAPVFVVATVSQPPDYIVHTNQTSLWQGAASGAVPGGGTNVIVDRSSYSKGLLTGPINTSETWTQHFTNNGFASPQAQITAGYPYYLQPPPGTAQYVETFDVGSLITSMATVTIDGGKNDIVGAPVLTITVEKSTDGSSWTTVGTGAIQYVANFQYIRITWAFTSASGAFFQMKPPNIRIDAKEKTDSGTAIFNSTGGGTTVPFNKSFGKVKAVQVTVNGDASFTNLPWTAIVDFNYAALGPTSFNLLVYDKNGTRVGNGTTTTISWTARGA
jgi:predicted phage tail protein